MGACSAQETEILDEPIIQEEAATIRMGGKVPPTGEITITTEALSSEDAACIIPIQIRNGTDAMASVSMFGFDVTGDGDADTGNMFPQDVPAGEYRTARIIQIGQSCAAFDTITPKDVLCKTGGETCEVSFEDSSEITFATSAN
ncbi:hypothetical protein ACJ3XI_11410 [Litorimonas sp. RW-G-Af-16]|uniref:hypothetical protein n=1 Tax=Litorimonas sp. RW-G-Af-16 TaxID=3241168 RepID=UPI00390C9636